MEHLTREEYLARVRERTAACARELLAGRLGVVEGVRRLVGLVSELDQPELESIRLVFVGVDSQTDHLPIGEVRRQWAPSSLAAVDAEHRDAEATLRTGVADACRQLLAALERAV